MARDAPEPVHPEPEPVIADIQLITDGIEDGSQACSPQTTPPIWSGELAIHGPPDARGRAPAHGGHRPPAGPLPGTEDHGVTQAPSIPTSG
jgi:hypothetical protein